MKNRNEKISYNALPRLTVDGKLSVSEHNIEDLPSALASLDEIRGLLTGKRPFIALDYDGTLTPIVERPDLAVLSAEMRSVVEALANRCTVAVISGRDLTDVKELVGLDDLFYAGSHGFAIAGPEDRPIASQQGTEFLPVLGRSWFFCYTAKCVAASWVVVPHGSEHLPKMMK